ncbi:MAG: uncharacterized protein K0R49_931 [Burkholderiales bacterium]|jgi:hypothetical protein|nr:uncharacterized protein [Burkholderiales bacterium]
MLKNYFHSFFNKNNANEETYTVSAEEEISFVAFIKKLAKERPLELIVPASTLFIVVITCVGLSLVRHDTSHVISEQNVQASHTKEILSQINDINNQLQILQRNPEVSPEIKDSLMKINTSLDNIPQSIVSMKDDMDSQMTELKKVVNANPNMKQYLDVKELPFKVISIDVLGEQPFASVNYDDHIQPMAVGDAIAGWVLNNADFSTATAEFKNAKDQYIKVIIAG